MRIQSRSCAKRFAITAKPLFIGSIPIAASKTSIIIREYSPHGLVSQSMSCLNLP
jgi:hypothetical protein